MRGSQKAVAPAAIKATRLGGLQTTLMPSSLQRRVRLSRCGLAGPMMIVVAIGLGIAEVVGKRERSMENLGVLDALAVGGAQVLALIPGSSRSGSTIMGGLFVGETRETAARFSFLLSIPAIAASGLLELKEAFEKLPPGSYLALAIATVVSGLVGYASIWFLLRFLRKHSTAIFIAYRLLVGVLIILALLGGYFSADIV